MNERIKQLAEQATEDILGVKILDQKKFAELIVQECAGISEQHNRNYYTSHGQIIADKIRKHFGVEGWLNGY